jgi:anti-sigma B factor antagonist
MNVEKFLIDRQETDKEYVFYLSGELDLSVAPQLRTALESVVNQIDKPLILNLKQLKYIDSTGIGIIISVLKVRDELNAPFTVREIPAPIKRLFDLTGISEFLKEGKENEA